MCDRVCPECGSEEHHMGYGLAVGGIGTYISCSECYHNFDFRPDTQDIKA